MGIPTIVEGKLTGGEEKETKLGPESRHVYSGEKKPGNI